MRPEELKIVSIIASVCGVVVAATGLVITAAIGLPLVGILAATGAASAATAATSFAVGCIATRLGDGNGMGRAAISMYGLVAAHVTLVPGAGMAAGQAVSSQFLPPEPPASAASRIATAPVLIKEFSGAYAAAPKRSNTFHFPQGRRIASTI